MLGELGLCHREGDMAPAVLVGRSARGVSMGLFRVALVSVLLGVGNGSVASAEMPNPQGDKLSAFLEPQYRQLLKGCRVVDLGKVRTAIPMDVVSNLKPSIEQYVLPIWQGSASLDMVFGFLFKTDKVQAELYNVSGFSDPAFRGLGLSPSIVPSPNSASGGLDAIYRLDTCTSAIGAGVKMNGDFGVASLKSALSASDERQETMTILVGSFMSPLYAALRNDTSPGGEIGLRSRFRLWNYYSRHVKILKEPRLYYVSTFEGAAAYYGQRRSSDRKISAEAAGGYSFGPVRVEGHAGVQMETTSTTEIRSFGVYVKKDTQKVGYPLVATFEELDRPSQIAAWIGEKVVVGVTSDDYVIRRTQPFVHTVSMRGVPLEYCGPAHFASDDEAHVSLSAAPGADEDVCRLTATYETGDVSRADGFVDISYGLRSKVGISVNGVDVNFKIPVRVRHVPVERDVLFVASGRPTRGEVVDDAGDRRVSWSIPYSIIDLGGSVDSSKPIGVKFVSTTCPQFTGPGGQAGFQDMADLQMRMSGVIEATWRPALTQGEVLVAGGASCAVTVDVEISLRPGLRPRTLTQPGVTLMVTTASVRKVPAPASSVNELMRLDGLTPVGVNPAVTESQPR